jgi:hypothetical protein
MQWRPLWPWLPWLALRDKTASRIPPPPKGSCWPVLRVGLASARLSKIWFVPELPPLLRRLLPCSLPLSDAAFLLADLLPKCSISRRGRGPGRSCYQKLTCGSRQEAYNRPMKPISAQSAGTKKKIVGFHMDENRDWVADLECGHQKHVRNDPPYTEHHWVTTAQGRLDHMGQELPCSACRPGR